MLETSLKMRICGQHFSFLHESFSNCLANDLSGSAGICQWLSSWWWCILKNEIWGHSGADPASMYKCDLWVRTFDRFRITLIMWDWKLLIESKYPTNKNTCSENSAPIGNANVKMGKKKAALIYRNTFSLLFFFPHHYKFLKNIPGLKAPGTPCPLSFLDEKGKTILLCV